MRLFFFQTHMLGISALIEQALQCCKSERHVLEERKDIISESVHEQPNWKAVALLSRPSGNWLFELLWLLCPRIAQCIKNTR